MANHGMRTEGDSYGLWLHQKDNRGMTIWSVYADCDSPEEYLWVMHAELIAQKELPAWITIA